MSNNRVLVIGAHCDDESFGCLGTLLKHKEAGDKIFFAWYTDGRDQKLGALKCSEYFDAPYMMFGLQDQGLDTYPFVKLIGKAERAVRSFKPNIVYCPFIGDLNMDHRLVAEAVMVACRPYKFAEPPKVLMYSIEGTTGLGIRDLQADSTQYNIDVAKKITLLDYWYPNERMNGREIVRAYERFESWPVIK